MKTLKGKNRAHPFSARRGGRAWKMPEHKDDFSVSPVWRNAPVNPAPYQHLAATNFTWLLDWTPKPAGFKEGRFEGLRF